MMTEEPIHQEIQDEVKNTMNVLATNLDTIFNGLDTTIPPKWGFVLLTFKFGEKISSSRMNYISNGQRSDVVKAMQEFIDKYHSAEVPSAADDSQNDEYSKEPLSGEFKDDKARRNKTSV